MKKQVKSFGEFTNGKRIIESREFRLIDPRRAKHGGIITEIMEAFESFNSMSMGGDLDIDALDEFILDSPIGRKIGFTSRSLERLYTRFLNLYEQLKNGEITDSEYFMEFKNACESILGYHVLGY